MLVDEHSLPEVAQAALQARASGRDHLYVELVPKSRLGRFVSLWDGIAGEVVGRRYYEDDAGPRNVDIPAAKVVSHIVVRVNVTDVLNAQRAAAQRERRELAAPLRANQIVAQIDSGTAR